MGRVQTKWYKLYQKNLVICKHVLVDVLQPNRYVDLKVKPEIWDARKILFRAKHINEDLSI
jgi:hypothetical protein